MVEIQSLHTHPQTPSRVNNHQRNRSGLRWSEPPVLLRAHPLRVGVLDTSRVACALVALSPVVHHLRRHLDIDDVWELRELRAANRETHQMPPTSPAERQTSNCQYDHSGCEET